MPYLIHAVHGGFKVRVHNRNLSRKPLTLSRAKKQRIAVILSNIRRNKRI